MNDPGIKSEIRKLIDETNLKAMASRGRSCVATITKVFKLLPSRL